ncbi:MAG: cytochrome ubiquinol oxidase subunit I [Phycisphaerae bacterium]|jgi:cytochrome d ubiquinol oxidase subunit I
MDQFWNPVTLSRWQFAVTTLFHMLWPLLSIGLSLWLVILEAAWLRTRDEIYFRHVRFWTSLFLLSFGIGVASGVPLEFQFGTNWARFSQVAGGFFGNILGFEAAMAFMLEAAFLGIMIFGRRRVSPRMHFFATCMVALGASLSAFWIMDASAWMQTPAGVEIINGQGYVRSYWQAIFNPSWWQSFTHMWVACLLTSLFFVAGISAWYIRRGRETAFFLISFKVALAGALIVAPLQIYLGDESGRNVTRYQPAKTAAMEAHWQTNPPGQGADWKVLAWPNAAGQRNDWEVTIPDVLSLMTTRSLTGAVQGLTDFAPQDRPPVAITFWSFRLMVGIGLLMVVLAAWAAWKWGRGRLSEAQAAGQRRFWTCWVWSIPLGFLATDLGWIVREVGRQPWVIYGVQRTSDGVSILEAGPTAASLIGYLVVYVLLLGVFLGVLARFMRKGPDLTSPIDVPSREVR